MIRPPACHLVQIAREERARRKAAWERAGWLDSPAARDDEIIWSNIEHFARILNGEHRPISWLPEHKQIMVENIAATLRKAPEAFYALPGKVRGLRDLQYAVQFTLLYTLERPVPAHQARAAA
ncbi:hypothetical protein PMI04_014930 [Sphingobium sp. AP49]|uniref:hypothetical protein n=1 Tax=Sphingobium sp. AP49 TaxID=1144307 RepID=UPI00026EE72B|nr:hypothetical protein [Sphingobium sp. AP49]WHO37853.1 hypothetical protein PMI04_014930 [Sphingobium sp. AP49]